MLGLSESSTKVQSSDFHVRNLHSKRVVVEDLASPCCLAFFFPWPSHTLTGMKK